MINADNIQNALAILEDAYLGRRLIRLDDGSLVRPDEELEVIVYRTGKNTTSGICGERSTEK